MTVEPTATAVTSLAGRYGARVCAYCVNVSKFPQPTWLVPGFPHNPNRSATADRNPAASAALAKIVAADQILLSCDIRVRYVRVTSAMPYPLRSFGSAPQICTVRLEVRNVHPSQTLFQGSTCYGFDEYGDPLTCSLALPADTRAAGRRSSIAASSRAENPSGSTAATCTTWLPALESWSSRCCMVSLSRRGNVSPVATARPPLTYGNRICRLTDRASIPLLRSVFRV